MINNPKTTIGLNETQIGMVAPDWLCMMFQDTTGKRNAELHLQLGTLLTPEEALKIGLLDEIVSIEDFEETIGIYADRVLQMPSKSAIASTKYLLRKKLLDHVYLNR